LKGTNYERDSQGRGVVPFSASEVKGIEEEIQYHLERQIKKRQEKGAAMQTMAKSKSKGVNWISPWVTCRSTLMLRKSPGREREKK